MNNMNQPRFNTVDAMDMGVDQGLRAFMLGVYNKMAMGLALSALLAYAAANVPVVHDALFTAAGGMTGLGMAVNFSPLVLLLAAPFVMRNVTPANSGLLYWAVVSLIGLGFGVLALNYTGQSLVTTFLVTASSFGALSIYGYVTKKDLAPFRSFLIMAVWGLLIASLANMFFQSGMLNLVISGIGVLVFSGLVAHDTQNLKHTYYALAGNDAALGVATNYGALNLYLDFVNLFRFLLSFMGARR